MSDRLIHKFVAIVTCVSAVVWLTVPVHAQSDSTILLDPLQPQLDERKADFLEHAPKEKVDLFEGSINDLRASGILDRALNVGDTVADFALPNATGDTVTLAALTKDGPVVITWYRGGW